MFISLSKKSPNFFLPFEPIINVVPSCKKKSNVMLLYLNMLLNIMLQNYPIIIPCENPSGTSSSAPVIQKVLGAV